MTTREKTPPLATTRRQQAEERLLIIRNALEVADDEMERAFIEKDWETLGLDSWESYCAAIPEFRHFKMRAPARKERARRLRAAGATIPEIVAATGSSLGAIHRDLNPPKPAESFQVETPPAPPQCSNMQRAVSLVAAAGARGLTWRELCAEAGWHHGQASSALTKAHQRGLIYSSGLFRSACTVYVRTPESLRP